MATTVKYVTNAKPKVGGAIYSAPTGTALPTDATSALNAAFKCLGYVSDDGIQNSDERKTDDIKAWGGDIINSVQKEKTDTFKYTLAEVLNVDVLKEVYGDANVTGTLDTGVVVKSNSTELKEHVIVIELVLRDNVLKRIVIPQGKSPKLAKSSMLTAMMSAMKPPLPASPMTTQTRTTSTLSNQRREVNVNA